MKIKRSQHLAGEINLPLGASAGSTKYFWDHLLHAQRGSKSENWLTGMRVSARDEVCNPSNDFGSHSQNWHISPFNVSNTTSKSTEYDTISSPKSERRSSTPDYEGLLKIATLSVTPSASAGQEQTVASPLASSLSPYYQGDNGVK